MEVYCRHLASLPAFRQCGARPFLLLEVLVVPGLFERDDLVEGGRFVLIVRAIIDRTNASTVSNRLALWRQRAFSVNFTILPTSALVGINK
jgi:hypothetical protein